MEKLQSDEPLAFLKKGAAQIISEAELREKPFPSRSLCNEGIEKRPRYILPQKEAALLREQMCQWWLERWMRRRIEREDVLERMAKHSLVHPIRHGARIVLPQTDLQQPGLFEEWR